MTTSKTTLFYSLNMLLNEQEAINELRKYLTTNTYPARFPDVDQRKRYDNKFKKFKMEGTNIVYQPLKLKVIDKNKVQTTLKSEFTTNGLGKGIVAMYKHIQTKYIGIRRDDVKDFMSQNVQYQLAKPKRHRVNKPILASEVGELFSIDLIDMSLMKKNAQGYQYIFSCIDVFSRYVFLEAIKTKTAMATRAALQNIIERGDVQPRSILLDNGTEFKGLFKRYCEDNDIKLRNTRTHTPQANGIVERLNKEVRKVLKAIHVKDQTLIWHSKLEEVETAKNTTYHGSIKTTPQTVWDAKDVAEVEAIDDNISKTNVNQQTLDNLETRAEKAVAKFEETEFKKGDIVRIAMNVVYSDMRKLIKAGKTKQIVVWYVPRLFRIRSVINKARDHLERKQYTLKDVGHPTYRLVHPGNRKRSTRVWGSELIKTNLTDTTDMTELKALQLNQAKRMPGKDMALYSPDHEGDDEIA
jgi:hypothetical protein